MLQLIILVSFVSLKFTTPNRELSVHGGEQEHQTNNVVGLVTSG